MTHILLSLDTLKLWVVSLLINTFNFLYYCLQGSYVFSYAINKLPCLSVLLNNTRNIREVFSQCIFLFLVQWQKGKQKPKGNGKTHGQISTGQNQQTNG